MKWMLAAAMLVVASTAATGMEPLERHGKPIVRDAQSAIRIARTLELAMGGGPINYSEAEWLARCDAKLVKGVWHVVNKGPHKPRTGYFNGVADITINAEDGRFLGEMFID